MQVTKVVKDGEGTVVDLLGPRIGPLTPSEEESYCVMKGILPPGVSVPLHSHGDAESFYVLSGEAQVLAQTKHGLEWQTVRQGDFVHIPGGTKHAWRNLSNDPFVVIATLTPKLGRFLLELGEYVRTEGGSQFLEKLHELSERYAYWSGSPEENAAVGISVSS
jgi:quercetin dioxygenase-like cupin family protein